MHTAQHCMGGAVRTLCGLLVMVLARVAYPSAPLDSSTFEDAGEILTNMSVLALPPSESGVKREGGLSVGSQARFTMLTTAVVQPGRPIRRHSPCII